jgi:GMP synthase-like glutamine amidotransferase
MKVAILQCGNVSEKFRPRFGDYPEMVINMFAGIAPPLSFDTYDCQCGQLPDHINAYDFYITTGSRASVYEEAKWIKDLIHFIQMLAKHKKKLIGICFGHQLIAMVYQKKVKKSQKGWGVGLAKNQVIFSPEWMSENPTAINILASHQDQILELPENAQVIAESDFCPFFIVQWDKHFLSIQGHPEWQTAYAKALMEDRREIIPADRIAAGIESLQVEADNALFAQWIIAFVQQKS